MDIEPIKLTPEQAQLRGTAKSALYVECYKQIISQMREKGIRFPRDERGPNELGINASQFAKWCAFRDRGTLYNNAEIKKALPRDIKNIGIEDSRPRTFTEQKRDDLVASQQTDINEQGQLIVTLNAQVQTLEQALQVEKAKNKELELRLAASEQSVNDHMRTHAEQVKNSILSGGRSFDRA